MTETLLSPGVLIRENDTTQITNGIVTAGAAIVGPTVKGPVNIPTAVTSYSDFLSKFGGAFVSGNTTNEYLTSISAYNYFQQGGETLLVTRVVSGTFSPATSSIDNGVNGSTGNYASVAVNTSTFTNLATGSQYSIAVEKVDGNIYYLLPTQFDSVNSNLDIAYYNVNSSSLSWTSDQWGTALARCINNFTEIGLTASYNTSTDILTVSGSQPGVAFNGTKLYFTPPYQGAGVDLSLYASSSILVGGTVGTPNKSFVLETLSQGEIMNSTSTETSSGALLSGSADNIRWEVTGTNITNGTFNLLVRRGNDVTNAKTILESWTNLSLDPNQNNYIEAVIGNQSQVFEDDYIQINGDYKVNSRYVRVKEVLSPTLNYFDNDGTPKEEYADLIPVPASGTFGDGKGKLTSLNGLTSSNYTSSINILSNKEEYRYDIITVPGLNQATGDHSAAISLLVSTVQDRGDAIAIIDLAPKGTGINQVVAEASDIDSSYAASYYPWVQVNAPQTGKLTWVPPSTVMPSVFVYNDRVGAEWFAPAGFKRGGVGVLQTERKLKESDRDTLYVGKVNPLGTFPGNGVVAYGQKTLQRKPSSTDRINVRRLLIELKDYIGNIANGLTFENNTTATRTSFLAKVRPYLESIQQRQGLYAYEVQMDDENNTSDVIDRNMLIGTVTIQPTRTAEFIILDFNLTPTGSTFN